MPAAPRGLLRRVRLAPAGDEARRERIAVRRLLRLRSALVADKTQFRRDQASRIRALGPNFHALAEIHFATWSRWVASTGSSWYTAGVTARQRMAEAGYDVSRGDSWALNELTSAVRRGDGNARANIREFLRGLYEGDGSRPTKGAALVIGFGQRTGDVSVYQNTLQSWLADSAFWTDMTTYVSDWSQEVYGDIRAHAVPGEATSARREYLNDYLQHKLVLAGAGPAGDRACARVPAGGVQPARERRVAARDRMGLDDGSGRSRWPRTSRRRSTPSATSARRRRSPGTTGASPGRRGTRQACRTPTSPRRRGSSSTGSPPRSATRPTSSTPRTRRRGACGPGETLCALDLAGREAQRGLAVVPHVVAVDAHDRGAPGDAGRRRRVAAAPALACLRGHAAGHGDAAVELPGGRASRRAPPARGRARWHLPVAPGAVSTFYYRDTRAGRATLTASAPGTTQATREVTVVAGPTARIDVTPASRELRARGEATFTAAATDAFGNAAPPGAPGASRRASLGTLVRGQRRQRRDVPGRARARSRGP